MFLQDAMTNLHLSYDDGTLIFAGTIHVRTLTDCAIILVTGISSWTDAPIS